MRREYYILWLDDKIDIDTSLNNRIIKKIEEYVSNELAFRPVIQKEKNIENALKYCNSAPNDHRIDLFVSDFNLSNNENGFEFLKEVRQTNYKQDMILYSNNSISEITSSVINQIRADDNINSFSRFTFHSLNDRDDFIDDVKGIIDLNMEKWQELNALRGLYLAEVSQLEMDIKNKIIRSSDKTSYATKASSNISSISIAPKIVCNLNNFILRKSSKSILKLTFSELKYLILDCSDQLFNQWVEIAEIRNSFAHVRENTDASGKFIVSCNDNTKKYYESDIVEYRKKLFKFIDSIYSII